MMIDAISDLHGHYPKLEGGDILIVAGDLTARDLRDEYLHFCRYIRHSGYKKIIVIAGNHDNLMQKEPEFFLSNDQVSYLCDSGTQIFYDDSDPLKLDENALRLEDITRPKLKSLKIWGSPWTIKFKGMNPACMAFTCDTEEELAQKWALIPDDVDILVTHSPPYGIHDKTIQRKRVGSKSLYDRLIAIKPRVHVFGHIHECGYKYSRIKYPLKVEHLSEEIFRLERHETHCINASHVNEHYKPVNKPVRVIL